MSSSYATFATFLQIWPREGNDIDQLRGLSDSNSGTDAEEYRVLQVHDDEADSRNLKGAKPKSPKSTKAPSSKSTKAPSSKSTKAPSSKSTKAPSSKSTKAPSSKSTKAPSSKSTKAPSSKSIKIRARRAVQDSGSEQQGTYSW